MAFTASAPAQPIDDDTARRRALWLARVAELLWRDHGLRLEQLPADLVELGLASGDSPAEFVAGALP